MLYNYIAIEGNIGVGKTSLAIKIAEELNGNLILEEFADNPYLPKFYEAPRKYAFPLELFFLAERYRQLTKEMNRELFKTFTISDYFIGKSLVFSINNLKNDEIILFKKLYGIIYENLPKPDIILYLHKRIDKLQENIKKRGRGFENNIKDEYLESIQKNYFTFLKQQKNLRIVILNADELDFVNRAKHYKKIAEILETQYNIGINRVEL